MDINTLEAALGFGAGVAFTFTMVWPFIVSPLKQELKEERAAGRDFTNRILRKAGYDV